MSDNQPTAKAQRVSMRKRPASALPAAPVHVGRPRTIVAAVVALAVAGVAAVIAGLSLYGERGWLADSITKADRTAKPPVHRSASQLASHVSSVQSSQVVASVVLCVALALVAVAVYRGRHWSRWMVLGLWVVCSYTGTLAGLASVLSVSQSIPGPFKSAAFVSGAAFIVAVVAVNLRPSSQYFTAHKPAPREGAPVRPGFGSLFGPRRPVTPRAGAPARAATRPASGGPTGVRSKAKVRADEAAVARGAELARSRAKASKSRRTEV